MAAVRMDGETTMIQKLAARCAGAMFALGLAASAGADPGVSDTEIVFGQSAAFEGPAAALGTGMRAGILAAFEEANAAGGVNARAACTRATYARSMARCEERARRCWT